MWLILFTVILIILNISLFENTYAQQPTIEHEVRCYENQTNGKWCCYCRSTGWINGKKTGYIDSDEICSIDMAIAFNIVANWCINN